MKKAHMLFRKHINPHNNVRQLLRDLKLNNPDYPDVLILDDDLDDTKIKALYLLADVLVAPSLGEGFGLPIGEAMNLGLPVITTGWGGQLDFCNTTNAWLIDYKFVFSNTAHFFFFFVYNGLNFQYINFNYEKKLTANFLVVKKLII